MKGVREEEHEALAAGLDAARTVEAQIELVQGYVDLLHCHLHWEEAVDSIKQDWTLLVTEDHRQGRDKETDSDSSSLGEEDTTLASSSPDPDAFDDSLADILQKQQPPDPRVAAGLAALADSRNGGAVTNNTNDIHLVNLGVASAAGLWRRYSVRDKSPLSRELYKPLTPSEHNQVGTVYILKHNREPDLWKVGWTTRGAQVRLADSGNCYGPNVTIDYETSGGPFAGAFKAEKLAHAYLAERSLHIKRCKHCGRGHREWFRGPWDEIYSAVRIMEGLLRLPGYELRDGQMKLSAQVHEIFERNWTRSMADLEGLIEDLGAVPNAAREGAAPDVPATIVAMKELTVSEQETDGKMQRRSVVAVSEVEVNGAVGKLAELQITAAEVTVEASPGHALPVVSEKEPASPETKSRMEAAAANIGRKAGEIAVNSQMVWERFGGPLVQGFKQGKEAGLQRAAERENTPEAEASTKIAEQSPRAKRLRDRVANAFARDLKGKK